MLAVLTHDCAWACHQLLHSTGLQGLIRLPENTSAMLLDPYRLSLHVALVHPQ